MTIRITDCPSNCPKGMIEKGCGFRLGDGIKRGEIHVLIWIRIHSQLPTIKSNVI